MHLDLPLVRKSHYYGGMFRLSTCIAAIVLALASSGGQAQSAAGAARNTAPPRTILMFGASWCAPCIAEVRDIAPLAAGARPDRIVIVWNDRAIGRVARSLPDNVAIASPEDAARMADRYAKGVAGLPYNVMIGAQGRKCAELNAPLSVEAIKRMRQSCDAAPH